MNPVLNLDNYQIPFDLLIQQLQDYKLLPQLLQEIAVDELVERTAEAESIDLTYTVAEFEKLSAQVEQLPSFQGMNPRQLTIIIERNLKLQKFRQAKWKDEVEACFEAQKEGLDRLLLSILQVEDGSLAQELFFRIQAGEESFAEIALDHSQGTHAENGGILGPVLFKELSPAIGQMVRKLEPGGLSPLFQLDRHYTLFRLDELEPAKLDEQTHQSLLNQLFATWAQSQLS